MNSSSSRSVVLLLSIHLVVNINLINCGFYSSVEELVKWIEVKSSIVNDIDRYIQFEEEKIARIYALKNIMIGTDPYDQKIAIGNERDGTGSALSLERENFSNLDQSVHPIRTFVTLNRLVNAIEDLEFFLESNQNRKVNSNESDIITELRSKHNLPSRDDLIRCGLGLLRLQSFYDLDVDYMVQGRLVRKNILESPLESYQTGLNGTRMSADDCSELGKLAFDNGQYDLSQLWLGKALDIFKEYGKLELDEDSISSDDYKKINEVIEYLAFSSYKLGLLKYSARLTEAWLKRDPYNERARENLDYYLDELENSKSLDLEQVFDGSESIIEIPNKPLNLSYEYYKSGKSGTNQSPGTELSSDEKVRLLCREPPAISDNKCFKNLLFIGHHIDPELRIEVLHKEPEVIRIYDIVTESEVKHILEASRPKLQHSTVYSHKSAPLVTETIRLAKTAWLSKESDAVVENIEQRLNKILGIFLENSEPLQVVNYGLAGFYSPHNDNLEQFDVRKSNERMATILIYLNKVEAGGATVFPELDLKVEPVEKSALVWYNVQKNGDIEKRSIHTGCPILLGSKWIATKWPREKPNAFYRPCSLNKSSDFTWNVSH